MSGLLGASHASPDSDRCKVLPAQVAGAADNEQRTVGFVLVEQPLSFFKHIKVG
jgi:hypothetical protein